MLSQIKEYLDDVRSRLHLDPVIEKQVIGELHTYFQDKILELQDNGLSEKEAAREAVRSFGRARVVARLMYEAYSKGNWTETLLAALPHLIVASLFVSRLWYHPVLAPLAFAVLVGVTLFGWWHGKPDWLYSWIGYALFPLIVGGYVCFPVLESAAAYIFLGRGSPPNILLLSLIGGFLVVSLWIIIHTTVRVARRDWILASMMLTPLPIMASWLFILDRAGGLFWGDLSAFQQWNASMALVLGMLAIASATFIRLRKRVLKGIALITLACISMTIIGNILWENQGFAGFLGIAVLSLIFLISPAILEVRASHREAGSEAWLTGDWIEHPSDTK